jgi:hypothetical protein
MKVATADLCGVSCTFHAAWHTEEILNIGLALLPLDAPITLGLTCGREVS